MPLPDDFEQRIRYRIAAHLRQAMQGVSQRQMGSRLGMNGASLSRIITGDRTPGLDVLARLHANLGIDANTLLDVDPPEEFFRTENDSRAALKQLADVASDERLPADLRQRLASLVKRLGDDASES